MTVTQLRKQPLLMQYVKDTDTTVVLKAAIKLAEEHKYYSIIWI